MSDPENKESLSFKYAMIVPSIIFTRCQNPINTDVHYEKTKCKQCQNGDPQNFPL